MRTIFGLLARSSTNFPGREALRCPAQESQDSYADLLDQSLRVGARLRAAGVAPGDRVSLIVGNTRDFPRAYFGVFAAGAVAVPLSPRLTPGEISGLLRHAEVRCAIVTPELLPQLRSELGGVVLLSSGDEEFLGLGPEPPTLRLPGDDAEILYTSGTTGAPKGVVLTHEAVVEAAAMAAYEFSLRVSDRVLILMPLTHSAPLHLFLLGATYVGATVVLDAFNPRDPAAMFQVTERERTSCLFAAPVAYLLGLRAGPERFNLSSMRLFVYGGAPMATAQVKAVRQAYGGSWMGVYGLTESGPNGMPLRDEEHPGHEGSLGWRPTVNTVLRLVGPAGEDVPPGEPGEIVMRTTSAMRGYLKNPEATEAALQDGWIRTGDMARRDPDGYYWILDRKKDLILSGGRNIYPHEVEEAILGHPAVADVAVVGTPHPEWGETVTAVVVLRAGETLSLESVREYLRPRLESQKHPRRLEIVEQLPRNATGKLLKHVIRSSLV